MLRPSQRSALSLAATAITIVFSSCTLPFSNTEKTETGTVAVSESPTSSAPASQTGTSAENSTTPPTKIEQLPFETSTHIDTGYTVETNLDADFNGDGILEKVISYYSSEKNRWKIRVFEQKDGTWKIIKEDQASRGQGRNAHNPEFLAVHDFGHDGKDELLVAKVTGDVPGTRNPDIRYGVFGIVDGTYGDYPIPRGYLHPEWLPKTHSIQKVEMQWDKIVENYVYELPNQQGTPLAELKYSTFQIFQNYENGGFVGHTEKKLEGYPITDLVTKVRTFDSKTLGVTFHYTCYENIPEHPLLDMSGLRRENGKLIASSDLENESCGRVYVQKRKDFDMAKISTFGGILTDADLKKSTHGGRSYRSYSDGDMGFFEEVFITEAGGFYYTLHFSNNGTDFGADINPLQYDEKVFAKWQSDILESLQIN